MADEAIISAGTVIRGRIKAEVDLQVRGHVEGAIEADGVVTIASGAAVSSDVSGRSVHVAGAAAGNLTATDRIMLEDGARVVGDLSAPSIGIQPGALLRGRVETGGGGPSRTRESKAVPAARPAATKKATKVAAKKATRRAPAPTMPKAKTRKKATKKTAASKTRAKKKAPAPKMPALRKRTKKASKRRAR